MTDHVHELRQHARKIGHHSGDIPAVMQAAADHIDDLERRLREAESRLQTMESALRRIESGGKNLEHHEVLEYLHDIARIALKSPKGRD